MNLWIDVRGTTRDGKPPTICVLRPCGIPRDAPPWAVCGWLLDVLYPQRGDYATWYENKLWFAARVVAN